MMVLVQANHDKWPSTPDQHFAGVLITQSV